MSSTVLCLIADPILSLDVQQALESAGLGMISCPDAAGPFAAVIVDTDDLDPKHAPNPDCPMASRYPVIVIADSCSDAAAMKAAGWFAKPVVSDKVVDLVVRLVHERKESVQVLSGGNAAG